MYVLRVGISHVNIANRVTRLPPYFRFSFRLLLFPSFDRDSVVEFSRGSVLAASILTSDSMTRSNSLRDKTPEETGCSISNGLFGSSGGATIVISSTFITVRGRLQLDRFSCGRLRFGKVSFLRCEDIFGRF